MSWQEDLATLPEQRTDVAVPVVPPRYKLTVPDVMRMVEAGVLGANERVELWDGELIEMSPKQFRHEWIKSSLNEHLTLALARRFKVWPETTVFFSRRTYVEPDIVVSRRGARNVDLRGPDLLLTVEVADSSFNIDTGSKPALYAAHDAPLLWVVDARDDVTPKVTAYSDPTDLGYAHVREFDMDAALTLPFAPDIRFTLREVLYEDEEGSEP